MGESHETCQERLGSYFNAEMKRIKTFCIYISHKEMYEESNGPKQGLNFLLSLKYAFYV